MSLADTQMVSGVAAVQDFSSTERKELAFVIDRAADASIALLANGLEAAQNAFHATP